MVYKQTGSDGYKIECIWKRREQSERSFSGSSESTKIFFCHKVQINIRKSIDYANALDQLRQEL